MYRIGELAKLLSVSTDTLRYYEKHGLLMPSGRSHSGYRLYNEACLQCMQFIVSAKSVGFSLNEIKELLSIKVDKNSHSCGEVKSFTLQKKQQVEVKIAELTRFKDSLQLLSDACCGGDEVAVHCSILSALENIDDTDSRIIQ
ncbi:Zn(2+)-responsive transcriptional regulator [Pseudoalteromonas denitrificans]|uniref:MerR family transcriptional regulator, Zn(II)-responsive regulator of zntA n=1 Tax=Pseudoalteromonas denitrificans DSM 6059 TaxID=1123010 RepID=A0A1I1E835_9GAMM|nr:Zn(2+)-responsive transcriptional regulator [Pseudoalteromonas denitrificans]SFB82856.1 MerR family transcriptional regulator, Zn(II)-responsive regulator of zntA [Pseudoalteromonas denitrificans DSM 6059]